jgi:hypothetical protein
MVTTPPDTEELTPGGKPLDVAPVAPPPRVMVIFVIATFTQTG